VFKSVSALSVLAASLALTVSGSTAAPTQLLGPTPYRSFADSPFAGLPFAGFQLETFEDHLFNVPGARANTGLVTGTQFTGIIIDSVDGDDGSPTNGTCIGCDSYYSPSGPQGIVFTFDPQAPGGLPTHAGIVWTDGEGFTTFEAFDRAGASMGLVGPVAIADQTHNESTAEDHFFGVIDLDGISAIKILNTPGGIEVDHLQFGFQLTGVCFDGDHDGYGFPGAASCPAGDAEDCDDSDPAISPAASEIYDAIDNNCNAQIDEGLDDDGDGVPNFADACAATPASSGVDPHGCAVCGVEPDMDRDGYPASADCNDLNTAIHPGATEACNQVDDDCDGRLDEGFDLDADGFTTCAQPVADCNDSSPAIRPGATELPGNIVDENCDGSLGACDPNATWLNHGEFVRCVAAECGELVMSGTLSELQCDALVSQAGMSNVGKPAAVKKRIIGGTLY